MKLHVSTCFSHTRNENKLTVMKIKYKNDCLINWLPDWWAMHCKCLWCLFHWSMVRRETTGHRAALASEDVGPVVHSKGAASWLSCPTPGTGGLRPPALALTFCYPWGRKYQGGANRWSQGNFLTIAGTTEDTHHTPVLFGPQHSCNSTYILLASSPQPDCKLHEGKDWSCWVSPHHFIFITSQRLAHNKNSINMCGIQWLFKKKRIIINIWWVFYCYHENYARWRCKTTDFFSHCSKNQQYEVDLGGRKSRCGQDCTPFWRLQGESTSLCFPPSRSFLHSLTRGPVLHLQIQQHPVKPASHCSLSDLLSYLPRPLLRMLVMMLVPPRSSRTLSPS